MRHQVEPLPLYKVKTVFTWTELEAHFRRRLTTLDHELRHAEGAKVAVAQGRALAYEELLNLPQTLAVLE